MLRCAPPISPPEIPPTPIPPPPLRPRASTIMRYHLLWSTITMPPSAVRKPVFPYPSPSSNSQNCPSLCRHSPSATLDLLIFVVVIFAGAFLITSYFSYLFQSISLLLPPFSSIVAHFYNHLFSDSQSQFIFFALFSISFLGFVGFFEICCGHRSRRCGRTGCRGLKKGMEFDLLLQGEELLRTGDGNKAVRDVNELPWKGGGEDNPDYECLRVELRKMAPPNGRAVLLFCMRCGCPTSKLEGWGTKRGRRNKKGLALTSGGDHS